VSEQCLTLLQCCSPDLNGGGGWGIFNAILGWTNSATYGSVISYNLYWAFVILGFLAMRYHETRGHWPLLKKKAKPEESLRTESDSESTDSAERRSESRVVAVNVENSA
jgi:high-affinity iron transporter